jgi:cytochrome c biogenesis protein CcdA
MAAGLNPLLAFVAGGLTILSPCVLPLVPVVMGSAAQRHRLGPLALTAGLVISFTLVGFGVATLGASIGLDGDAVRKVGAVMLMLIGAALCLAPARRLVERLSAPLASWASERQAGLERHGLLGQAGIGVLLGLVWSPCAGPTLGAATVLAAQGRDLATVALIMLAFGLGIALILLLLAFATRSFLSRWRGKLMNAGGAGRLALGALLLTVGVMIFTDLDRTLENAIVTASPDWLVALTTRY